MRNVLFLTSSSLATNPRLVKNYIYFKSIGCRCTVVAFKYGNWTDRVSEEIIAKHSIKCVLISASRKPLADWLKAAFMDKASKLLYHILPSIYWSAIASSKRTYQLLSALRKIDFPVDFIQAHTLPTLLPAEVLSKRLNVDFSFDVEDYHPGELIGGNAGAEVQRRIKLMSNLLTEAKLVSAASPLIKKEVEALMNWNNDLIVTVNNSFYSNEFIFLEQDYFVKRKVQFIWFSQKITFG